jgi:hypothetical protein
VILLEPTLLCLVREEDLYWIQEFFVVFCVICATS